MGNLLGRLGRRLGPEWKVHLVGCYSNSQNTAKESARGVSGASGGRFTKS